MKYALIYFKFQSIKDKKISITGSENNICVSINNIIKDEKSNKYVFKKLFNSFLKVFNCFNIKAVKGSHYKMEFIHLT